MARCLKRTTDPAFSSARGNPLAGSHDHVVGIAGERFGPELLALLGGDTSSSQGLVDYSNNAQRMSLNTNEVNLDLRVLSHGSLLNGDMSVPYS